MSTYAASPLIVPLDLDDPDNIWALLFRIGHDARARALHMQRDPVEGHWCGFWATARGERAIGWQVSKSAWPALAGALHRRQQSMVDLHLSSTCASFLVSGFWLAPGSISYLYFPETSLNQLWKETDGMARLNEQDRGTGTPATKLRPSGSIDGLDRLGTEGFL